MYTDQESTHVTTKFSWRRALAVPAALSLALGGVLLTSTAAQAAPAELVISTPVAGSTADSRQVTVSGTVRAGSRVDVYKGTAVAGDAAARITVGNQTTWSTVLTYSDTDTVAQNITVSGLVGLSGIDPQTIAFNLPAVAPVQTFSVTAPTTGSQLSSRTVTFSGTGNDGSTVNILRTDGSRLVPAVVVTNGAWTATYTYAETETREQTVNINQVTGASGNGAQSVTFNLPTGQTLVVNTPVEGSTTESRTVVFSGTGNAGSTVNVLDADGNRLAPQARVGDDGTWTTTYVYSDDAAVAQTVRVTQVTGASGSGDITRNFNLAAVEVVVPPVTPSELVAPVITSPIPDQVIVGSDVVISGTGTPGDNIAFVVYPKGEEPASSGPLEDAIADESIVVDENGNWTSTLRNVKAGDFTVVAFAFELDADGNLADISEASNEVDFSVVAAVVPAGTTPVAATPAGLAYTGSDNQGLALGLGAALTLAGAGLAFAARRRAKLASIAE